MTTEKKIRERVSYKVWKVQIDFLRSEPSIPQILDRIHKLLDGRSAYGSRTNSGYSFESLVQALKDEGKSTDEIE